MLKITEILGIPATPSVSLTLPFEKRQKSRLRVSLNDKQEAALMLERGSILRHGDLLQINPVADDFSPYSRNNIYKIINDIAQSFASHYNLTATTTI